MVHRAGLNPDEVTALHGGTLLQASLELYAPLADDSFENRSQSMTTIKVNALSVTTSEN